MDRNKIIYIIGFIISISIIPLAFGQLFIEVVGEINIDDYPKILAFTLVTRSWMIGFSTWYGLKVGIKPFWAVVLGFGSAMPIIWLISVAYLLTRKQPYDVHKVWKNIK